MNSFDEHLSGLQLEGLHAFSAEVFQVNLGLRCNLCCTHCHMGSNPERTEVMSWETMQAIVEKAPPGAAFDLTGGSPEMNPDFMRFVKLLKNRGHKVQVRTNLAIMEEPGFMDLPAFYRDNEIPLVASMPCYLEENVSAQRGPGVYEASISIIKKLNALGYGSPGGPALNLVYNPGGPFLPPPQKALEGEYKKQLKERFEIDFTNLLTITNMPLGRFLADLKTRGEDQTYKKLLVDSFNSATLRGLMCRSQISISWDGYIYDCDFNQSLDIKADPAAGNHISRFDADKIAKRKIVTCDHCFGCTAGAGSSCGGALDDDENSCKAA